MKNIVILIMSVLLAYLGYNYYHITSFPQDHQHTQKTRSKVENGNQTVETQKQTELPTDAEHTVRNNTQIAKHNAAAHQHMEKIAKHSHTPDAIKQKLCEEVLDGQACVIKQGIDIQKAIVDGSSNNALADGISIVLGSSNFQQVMENIAASKLNTASFERELKLNSRIDNFIASNLNVSVDRVACGDIACGTSIHYNDTSDWQAFESAFFQNNDSIGNLFITHVDNHPSKETRILFLSNDISAVQKRIK